MKLAEAQIDRRVRGEELALATIDALVDHLCDALESEAVHLAGSSAVKNYQLVGADKRKKLKGLLDHYRKDPHPFTACVTDNTKRFGAAGAKKVCAVLTDIEKNTTKWRNGGNHKAVSASMLSSEAVLPQPGIDDDLFGLLVAIGEIDYREILGIYEEDPAELLSAEGIEIGDGEKFYVVGAHARSRMPASDFALPSQRKYLMHDRKHGGLALGRAKGKPEFPQVKAAVCKRYPDLPSCKAKPSSGGSS